METSSTREVEPGPPAAASRQRGASTDHGEPQEVEAPHRAEGEFRERTGPWGRSCGAGPCGGGNGETF